MSVMSMSLRDRRCRAEFNGTHFLLDFPLISCGTEGEMDGMSGRVRYTNTVRHTYHYYKIVLSSVFNSL